MIRATSKETRRKLSKILKEVLKFFKERNVDEVINYNKVERNLYVDTDLNTDKQNLNAKEQFINQEQNNINKEELYLNYSRVEKEEIIEDFNNSNYISNISNVENTYNYNSIVTFNNDEKKEEANQTQTQNENGNTNENENENAYNSLKKSKITEVSIDFSKIVPRNSNTKDDLIKLKTKPLISSKLYDNRLKIQNKKLLQQQEDTREKLTNERFSNCTNNLDEYKLYPEAVMTYTKKKTINIKKTDEENVTSVDSIEKEKYSSKTHAPLNLEIIGEEDITDYNTSRALYSRAITQESACAADNYLQGNIKQPIIERDIYKKVPYSKVKNITMFKSILSQKKNEDSFTYLPNNQKLDFSTENNLKCKIAPESNDYLSKRELSANLNLSLESNNHKYDTVQKQIIERDSFLETKLKKESNKKENIRSNSTKIDELIKKQENLLNIDDEDQENPCHCDSKCLIY